MVIFEKFHGFSAKLGVQNYVLKSCKAKKRCTVLICKENLTSHFFKDFRKLVLGTKYWSGLFLLDSKTKIGISKFKYKYSYTTTFYKSVYRKERKESTLAYNVPEKFCSPIFKSLCFFIWHFKNYALRHEPFYYETSIKPAA